MSLLSARCALWYHSMASEWWLTLTGFPRIPYNVKTACALVILNIVWPMEAYKFWIGSAWWHMNTKDVPNAISITLPTNEVAVNGKKAESRILSKLMLPSLNSKLQWSPRPKSSSSSSWAEKHGRWIGPFLQRWTNNQTQRDTEEQKHCSGWESKESYYSNSFSPTPGSLPNPAEWFTPGKNHGSYQGFHRLIVVLSPVVLYRRCRL